jgi:hypothetical protein
MMMIVNMDITPFYNMQFEISSFRYGQLGTPYLVRHIEITKWNLTTSSKKLFRNSIYHFILQLCIGEICQTFLLSLVQEKNKQKWLMVLAHVALAKERTTWVSWHMRLLSAGNSWHYIRDEYRYYYT